MRDGLKWCANRLPERWQQRMKRGYFSWQIRRGAFRSDEPEFALLDQLVASADWVLDIDTEERELAVLAGTASLLQRDRPTLIVEGARANPFLESLGYVAVRQPGSPNYLWRSSAQRAQP